ncbi:MAG: hypothetical protein WC812_01220 [Candidatus Pacearchaeota archaeon]|jgi:hypothetical protein
MEEFQIELNLLKNYMDYYIDQIAKREEFLIRKREWNNHGPTPRQYFVRSEQDLNPLSFENWKKFYSDSRD